MDSQTRNKAAIVAALLVASLLVVVFKINISTDLKLFLPEPSNKIERLLHHQLDNGASTKLVFIALTGLPPKQLAAASDQLTKDLAQSPLFNKVINRATNLSAEGLEFVEEHRYHLSHNNLSQLYSEEGLKTALADRVRGLSSPEASLEKKYLRKDPGGETLALLSEWQGKLSKHKRPEELHGMWFSGDHQRALILAETGFEITRLENQVESIEAIRSAFAKIRTDGLEMILTGPSAFAVESGEDIKNDVRTLTWLAIIFVTSFLMLVYRSIGMLLLVFCPMLAGIVAATAAILIFQGQIHGITLAFGITLAGVAVDYPIHLLTGLSRRQRNAADYVSKIWPTLRLGVISTVIAYASFLGSGFGGLQQLGLFTIIGLSVAAAFSRWILPVLLRGEIDRRQGLDRLHGLLRNTAQSLRGMRIVVPLLAFAALSGLAFTSQPILHLNVDSLSPIQDSRRAQGKQLRNDLGYWYGGRMMVVAAEDKNAVLLKTEMLEQYLDELIAEGVLEGYDMASQFLPSHERQSKNLAVFQNPGGIKSSLSKALEDSQFRPRVFDPFVQQLDALTQAKPIDIEQFLNSDLGRRLQPLVFDFENNAAGVILLHGVSDESSMRQFADAHEDVYFMHLKTSATELVERSVHRVGWIMLICIVLIYLALLVAFRSVSRPLKILIPTFASAIVTAALLVFFDCPLSIFHLISLMLVIGLGLDYALFFNRLPGNEHEWNTTFKSLWICGLTTILVFGILVVSKTPPLKAIGMTVGIGAFLSILFAAMWATAAEKPAQSNG